MLTAVTLKSGVHHKEPDLIVLFLVGSLLWVFIERRGTVGFRRDGVAIRIIYRICLKNCWDDG